ncbi:MAG: prolipoprotein diacylglyceryl transferase [Acidobacteriota bacterium]
MFPRLFTIGPYEIPRFWILGPFHLEYTQHTYGAILALAFLAAIVVVVMGAKREGVPEERIFDLAVYAVISALIGAKALLVLSDLGYYTEHPGQIFSQFRSGGVFYGGFLCAGAVSYWYLRKHQLPIWKVGDLIAPGIAIGQAIGRLGCFAAGCCYGKPSSLPWAVTFRDVYCFETVGTPLDISLHPTQLYESLAAFMLFLVLMFMRRRKTFDGQIFWLYATLYSVIRLAIEFFRNDERGFVFGLLSTSQSIALLMLPFSIFVYFGLRRRAERAES